MTVKYMSRVTRAISLSASRQSGIRWRTWFVVPTSNEPDLNGRRAASAKITSRDRKSTRLNSSHRCISYAVFCLKKKKTKEGKQRKQGKHDRHTSTEATRENST